MSLICGFKDIYDRFNFDGRQYPLMDVKINEYTNISNACNNPSLMQENGNRQIVPKPKSIQINQDIIDNLYDDREEIQKISEVPIYFVVLKIRNNDEYKHISLFIYFKKWFSIGLSQCGLSSTANLLTPDNIFNTITHELFVIDFGILNESHINGINKYVGRINYHDSHINSNYYTYNLKNISYSLDSSRINNELYNCAKFILTIFEETIDCSRDKSVVSISNLSRKNKNLVNCENINLDVSVKDFLEISAGSSSSFSHLLCEFTSIIMRPVTSRMGGLSLKKKKTRNKKKKKRRTNKKTYKR
jgi:hypothetical protein